jgi:hypothetical protein
MPACPPNIPCDLSTQRAVCNTTTGQWRCSAIPDRNPDSNGPPVDPCPPDPPCAIGYSKILNPGGFYECLPCNAQPRPEVPAPDPSCPPGQHRGGGHPGNPCRPDNDPTVPSGGGSTTSTTRTNRFYVPSWEDYFWSGQVGANIPQPQGDLLNLLSGGLFQQAAGQYGIAGIQDAQRNAQGPIIRRETLGRVGRPEGRTTPRLDALLAEGVARPTSVLGLQGGGAALGYIDPSWMFDTRTVTTGGGGGGGAPVPGTPTPTPGSGGNPCGGTQGCPPGQHRAGCHPGNPCRPDGASTPAPTPAPAPGAPAPTPGPTPAPAPPEPSGNPCGGQQGCPPGQHRAGCHPGNPCRPDNTLTSSILTSAQKPKTSGGSNAYNLLNPGTFGASF